ncbi:hypothetical protein [Brevibacillus laterosporus]|uniref:Uncharacterized protein n=1 Tax=Brevibacillus laterosporus TaxID=1465 RepID=A0AAP3DKC5_BRELA|nr:hypothetical protein [Brevibacillus laterosporus]MCR8982078.1 hypothetical protein [Brevibacillus laterosporus]MCZ0809232.1 hypothetical protein [Brevibacillus laterosporus]MCZ0827577.1 hypothetical protein [Brevibacillus laterosporus]MCZ0851547.1 hypothetical protein [Brevibacillus laterosporus]
METRTISPNIAGGNSHLDSKYLKDEHQYKVEIQYKNLQPGQGRATVSLVLVNEKATRVEDLREA